MSRDIPFRSLQDCWREGPRALLASLEEQGFAPVASRSFEKQAENFFSRALRARAFRAEMRLEAFDPRQSFAYLSRDTSPKSLDAEKREWAFVLADKSFEKSDHAFFGEVPTLFVKNPDAALDYVLSKTSPAAWAAPESYGNPRFEGVLIEPGALIGPDCEIGRGTIIESGVRIGARVVIGTDSRIGAHSRLADDCRLGQAVTLASHVSLGGQGFGFVKYPRLPAPRPRLHVGRVIVGDGVRMGSQVAIDRGVFEDTVVGDASAFDNHVQIAHNCVVGKHNVYCAFVGLSGSTVVGDRVTFGAMSGTKGHLHIGADSIVAGQSGVSGDLPPKSIVKGYPPRPVSEALKIQVLVGKLPELFSRLKKLEKEASE